MIEDKIDIAREALGNSIIGGIVQDDEGQELLVLHVQSYEEVDEIVFNLVGVTGSRKVRVPRKVFYMDGYVEEIIGML